MTSPSPKRSEIVKLRLPATSANLGAGFDAVAVALDFCLTIEAAAAPEFTLTATGRNSERCGQPNDNLILDLYRKLLTASGRQLTPLALRIDNAIPLGVGCGSSAAARLAGIMLANHFGDLGWSPDHVLAEACMLEGHPDNAAACWLGGFVAAAWDEDTPKVAHVVPPSDWRAIVVLPANPLSTSKARAVLPDHYLRSATVSNIQSASMLGLAFAQARTDLLRIAMRDRVHQPFRSAICPMLPRLLPLQGSHGILGAALSGAGPAVLVITANESAIPRASDAIREALDGLLEAELLISKFVATGALHNLETGFDGSGAHTITPATCGSH